MTINLKKWDSNVNEKPAKYLILFLSGILVIQAICGINKRWYTNSLFSLIIFSPKTRSWQQYAVQMHTVTKQTKYWKSTVQVLIAATILSSPLSSLVFSSANTLQSSILRKIPLQTGFLCSPLQKQSLNASSIMVSSVPSLSFSPEPTPIRMSLFSNETVP